MIVSATTYITYKTLEAVVSFDKGNPTFWMSGTNYRSSQRASRAQNALQQVITANELSPELPAS